MDNPMTRERTAGRVWIISRSSRSFRDREEAGQLLAQELTGFRGQRAVVLGIPRGGIIVAREVANALDAELDIVLSHKLRTPGHPELALGSIAENGELFLNRGLVKELNIGNAYINQEAAQQLTEIKRRSELIRGVRPKVPLKGRLVIVTDDGIATGATTQAALRTVRGEQPQKLIAALPVGAEETVLKLSEDADEIICLRAPPSFAAVGQFYARFNQVEDEEVMRILQEEYRRKTQKWT